MTPLLTGLSTFSANLMSVWSFCSFSSGEGSKFRREQRWLKCVCIKSNRLNDKQVCKLLFHAQVLYRPFFFSTFFSGGRTGLRLGFSGLDLLRKNSEINIRAEVNNRLEKSSHIAYNLDHHGVKTKSRCCYLALCFSSDLCCFFSLICLSLFSFTSLCFFCRPFWLS